MILGLRMIPFRILTLRYQKVGVARPPSPQFSPVLGCELREGHKCIRCIMRSAWLDLALSLTQEKEVLIISFKTVFDD
jgi:hypothetical protein